LKQARQALVGVAAGGLIAGTLDIVYAFVLSAMRGGSPLRVLQSVASGLLGKPSYQGGWPTGALGLLLHMAICVAAALVFYLASRRSAYLRAHYLVAGAAFGIGVYLVMNFVVLPLSAVPFTITYTPAVIAQGFVSHALLVGLPITWCLRRYAFAR